MSKSLSKIIAIFLSAIMIISLPIVAGAEESKSEIKSAELVSADGVWKSDYIESLTFKLNCDAVSLGNNNVIFTIKRLSDGACIKTVNKGDVGVLYADGYVEIDFYWDTTLDHGETYVFTVSEGAFTDSNDNQISEYTFSETGNILVEMIEVQKEPLNPIQRLIKFLESTKFADILYPIINLLRWFDSL